MNIVFPDRLYFFTPDISDIFKKMGVIMYEDTPTSPDVISQRIKEAEIITANYIDITAEIIDAAPKLKYIIVPAVGFEWVDVKYAARKGIKVINCPTFNSVAVAEHALALMFAIKRKVVEGSMYLRGGGWNQSNFMGTELNGKKLGLIGHGNIGKNIDRLATALGMEVSYVNSKSTNEEVDKLLRESDVVCICAQLNDSTRHMVDSRRLALTKKGAYLINVSRGAVIDQKALIAIIKQGHFAGVGLDVFENEPLVGKAEGEITELVNLPRVVGVPHIGAATIESTRRLADEIYKNISACIAGKPINIVN
jgi:phosphoglycerate dehydrogenase-like enzyme